MLCVVLAVSHGTVDSSLLTSHLFALLVAHSVRPVKAVVQLDEELKRSVKSLFKRMDSSWLTLFLVTGFSGNIVLKNRFIDFCSFEP